MPTDKFAVRLVLIVLAIVTFVSLAALIACVFTDRDATDYLKGAFQMSLAALIGVIAATRTSTEPQQVQVANEPTDPVPVEPAG